MDCAGGCGTEAAETLTGWPTRRISGYPQFRITTMTNNRAPIISFASTKGGVGKTTLAFVLATAIARRLPHATEYRVACIDADPNGTLDAALRKSGHPDILSLP